jgi:outer membrane immunogenic protein
MKRTLFAVAAVLAASPALAADLPPPGPAPVAPAYYKTPEPAYYNWTGVYLGINGGGAFGQSNWTDPIDGSTGNFNVTGFLLGGTLGANYQFGSWVLGIEGDWDWSNVDATTFNASCAGVGCETRSDWLATVRGRVGYAWDRVLVYGTGGVAFADVEAGAGAFPFSSSTQVGWTVGGGVEYAFLPNLTAKVEYLFVDLQNQTCAFGNCGGGGFATPVNTSVSLNENIVRAGLNYKFGGGW